MAVIAVVMVGGGRNARVGVKGSGCVYGETIRRVMVD